MAISQALHDVLKKKLWIVTGKGGVGKTTLTAALGILCAKQGLSTLLVETHGLNHLGQLLEVGTVGYEGGRVRQNLELVQLNPEEAFEEYVLQQVKFHFIYNTVFKNQYVRHFIDAAPGLIELLTIGKIWFMVGEQGKKQGKKKPYDMVIVDAPSTGHGLSLLTVPEVVVSAVRVGPLKNKSQQILDLLRDPEKTMVWLATLPEEMPVNEAVEMAEKLKSEVKMAVGPIIANALWPEILDPESISELKKTKSKLPVFETYQKRSEQSRFYLDKLKNLLPTHPVLELPLVYHTTSPLLLAEHLSGLLYKSMSH
jgi:anion-transporting  ArsA/GET3 family ATPase